MAKRRDKKAPSLKDNIKAMEKKNRKVVAKPAELVSFDSWFHIRKEKIPAHHIKEIIWSYFKSVGLSKKELVATYDNMLIKYGIKL